MEQQIQISMLGRFAILVDGTDLVTQLSKSKKGLYLLQYLILQEGMPVQDTAQQVGYINVNTFRRAYRRQFGVNPSKEA